MNVCELKEFLNQSWVKDDMHVKIFDEYSRYVPIGDIQYRNFNILLIKGNK